MKRFLVLRENQRFELLLEKADGAFALETKQLAAPFDSFQGRRLPDQTRQALDQREEIREGGSRIVWDRGELSGEVSPGAAFEVELRGQRLIGRYRFEDRGDTIAVSRGVGKPRRLWLVLALALLLPGLIAGSWSLPGVRAQVYMTLASEKDAFLTTYDANPGGWAAELAGMGEAALPTLIPAALEEAEADRSAARRASLLVVVSAIEEKYRPPVEGADTLARSRLPEEVFRGLAACLKARASPTVRARAMTIILFSGDARCFALLLDHLRALQRQRGPWTFSPEGRHAEARLAFDALANLAKLNVGLTGTASPLPGSLPYKEPWSLVLHGLSVPADPKASELGFFKLQGRRKSADEAITELEAWLASKPEGLPEQIKAP